MGTRFVGALLVLCGLLSSVLWAAPALAERRVALVIGNSQYRGPGLALSNPRNDASDVAASLRALGFEVIEALDLDKRSLDLNLQKFARAATDADAVLFFYAGHAMQFQGRNYLTPIDAELEDEISLRYQMVSLDDVRAALDRANGVKIMILDACRNNPLADRLVRRLYGQNRSVGNVRGLARIDRTQGMVVAYATAADDVAQDGTGRNSPFTAALLSRMKEPGLEIEMMFRRVTADVSARTGGRQRPETYISLLSEYYLNQSDQVAWEGIKDSTDAAKLREFIARFPASTRALLARHRLDVLERNQRERGLEREREDIEELRARVKELERLRAEEHPAQPSTTPPPSEEERARVAALEEEVCRREGEWLARFEATGAREELTRLESSLACPRLRPRAQAAIAAVSLADTRSLISAAQRELRRLGCYGGSETGQLNEPTRDALRRYHAQHGAPAGELSITTALVAELRGRTERACVVAQPAEPATSTAGTASTATRRDPLRCKRLLERAMLGEISAADRAALQNECR
jgi:Caspase domain